ncbi:MAG: GNAT family N-acetyltransferase [Acetatifactor sp.]
MEIRPVSIEDAEQLLAIYAPYVRETAITFEYEVPTLGEFRERIQAISSILPYIVATEGEEIIGYAYAGKFKSRRAYDWSVEVTVYVRQESRRTGVGAALYHALEASLKEIGVLNMNACIALPKEDDQYLTHDSYYFHEKMGFLPVGTFHDSGYKFHTWYDMIWMEKSIGEHRPDQRAVRFGEWTVERNGGLR